MRPSLAQALDARLHDDPWRVEVRLADTEADDVVHRREDVEEAPDAGRRDDQHALGEDTLGQRWPAGHRHRRVGHARAASTESNATRSAGVGPDASAASARSVGSRIRQSTPAVIPSYPRARLNRSASDQAAPMS